MLKMAKKKFKEIYDNLPPRAGKAPKTVFVERMMEITKSSKTTVYGWIYGTYKPDALAQDIISKELGVPANELFASI